MNAPAGVKLARRGFSAHKRAGSPFVGISVSGEQANDGSELSSDQLKQAAVSGVRWFAAAKASTEVLQLAAAIALARLVSPADFGNAAIALILLPLAVILTYEGFGSALVQRKLVHDGHFEAATLTSLLAGLALSLATFLL